MRRNTDYFKLTLEQERELEGAMIEFSNRSAHEQDAWRWRIASDIHQFGNLSAAKSYHDAQRARVQKWRETMKRKESARYAAGAVYVYRFLFRDEWLYKVSVAPMRSRRLSLVRCIYIESGAIAFVDDFKRKYKKRRVRQSYCLSEKESLWLLNYPAKDAAPEPFVVYKETVRKGTRKSSSVAGFVYLLQSPTGLYKIGKTADINNRLRTFNVKLPFEVEYRHIIRTSDRHALESELHLKYHHRRVNGEWFDLTDSDVAEICAIQDAPLDGDA